MFDREMIAGWNANNDGCFTEMFWCADWPIGDPRAQERPGKPTESMYNLPGTLHMQNHEVRKQCHPDEN